MKRNIYFILVRFEKYLMAFSLFSIMLVMALDVIGRKFDKSIAGAVEVIEILMVMLIFSSLPLVSRNSEHISFDLLDDKISEKLSLFRMSFVYLICTFTFCLLSYFMIEKAISLFDFGQYTFTLKFPIWIVVGFIAFFLMITAINFFGLLITKIKEIIKKGW